MNYTDVISGLRATFQGPLDGKNYFLTKEQAGSFGIGNNKAFSYYKGMLTFLVEQNSFFVWDERKEDDSRSSLLDIDFVYPAGVISNEIDYSGKSYNFFNAFDSDNSFQFTDEEYDDILDLIFKPSIIAFSVSPPSGEKGVSTTLSLALNIQPKNDIYLSASISPGIGDVLNKVGTGINTLPAGTVEESKSFSLNVSYKRRANTLSESKTATYNAYVPQFAGVSVRTEFATYAQMVADLQKYVQATPVISKQSSPAAQYIWFISTKASAQVLDQNNFSQTVGNWNDGVSEFYTKSLVVTLNDGTTSTMQLYRSRNVKTTSNFTYKIQ